MFIGCNGRHVKNIVEIYVSERNYVIKRNIIIIWRTLTIKVTALLINLKSELKGVQGKESIVSVRGR